MSFAKGTDCVVLEKKQQVSDADIASYYLGITNIPTRINSPLRKEKHPSLGIYSRDGIHLYYIDFGTQERGTIIDLLKKIWGTSYNDTWKKVIHDLADRDKKTITIEKISGVHVESLSKTKTIIQVKKRDWKPYDLEYWNSYGISKPWLEFANIYPISHILFTKENKETYSTPADKYAYAYVEFKEGNVTFKIYQPYNTKGYKWFSSHDKSVISLWTKIPKNGDTVVICSSVKDALCFWSNTGIPAISPQGEGYSISETAVLELKRRYNNIYILYDNDEAGIKDSIKLAEDTGFIRIELPYFEGGKDVSDRYKILKNKALFRAEMINLLKQHNHARN